MTLGQLLSVNVSWAINKIDGIVNTKMFRKIEKNVFTTVQWATY